MHQFTDPISQSIPTHLVGIGASAGGLEAIERFFRATPPDTGMAFVVIQHLSPDFRSLMDELLARFTTMPVVTIESQTPIAPNHVYLLPPKKDAVVDGANLIAYDRAPGKQISMPINVFFNSLGESWGSRAVGIVLSGTGSDGSEGLMAIRGAGGYTMVQEPANARFDGMPVNAIATGCIDLVSPAENLPGVLLAMIKDPQFLGRSSRDDLIGDGALSLPGIKDIYDALNDHFALDFKQYKPSTIMRRIQRRASLGQKQLTLPDYAEKIKTADDELQALYRDLLIGVTGFFRDIEAFNVLGNDVLIKEIANLEPDQDYRVWVCGCSTGEEAYSLGMLLLEQFESLAKPVNLKVFATDVNREYINVASEGLYSADALEDVPAHLREKYFNDMGGGTYKVCQALRKIIIFSEHNLLKNPPFTRMNLVSCRNLLIYLKADAQAPAVTAFNFALVSGGVLFLGASETLGALADDFEPIDKQLKIYRKIRESTLSVPARPAEHVGHLVAIDYGLRKNESKNYLGRLYHTLLDKYIPFGLLVSASGEVLDFFGQDNRSWLAQQKGQTPHFSSLLEPALAKTVDGLIENLSNLNSSSERCSADNVQNEHGAFVKIDVESIYDKLSGQCYYFVIISPRPAGTKGALNLELDHTKIRDFSFPKDSLEYVKNLQNELMAAKEALQTNSEELETSNEELQASNEELQASNEELQSTNEELHSVNEELYTVNTELELKIVELDKTSSDLRNVVECTQVASVFLDSNYGIRVYTSLIQEVFALMPTDVGRDLRAFTPKVIDPDLWRDIEAAYNTQQVYESLAYAKPPEQKILWRRVVAYRNTKNEIDGVLLTFVDMSRVRARGLPLIIQGIKSILGLSRHASN